LGVGGRKELVEDMIGSLRRVVIRNTILLEKINITLASYKLALDGVLVGKLTE
jgi:hypothetical protein